MTSPDTARTPPAGIEPFMPLNPPVPAPLRNVSSLARQVQDLTAIVGILAVVSAVANIKLSHDVDATLLSVSGAEDFGSWAGTHRFVELLSTAISIGFTLNAVMTMVMLKRMLDNGSFLTPHEATHSSHWAITGWIIPIINWFRPYEVVRQIWETCRSSEGVGMHQGGLAVGLPVVIKFWWASFVLLDLLRYGIMFVHTGRIELDELGDLIAANAVYEALRAVTAVLFILTVRAIAARHAQGLADYELAEAEAAEPFTDDPIMY